MRSYLDGGAVLGVPASETERVARFGFANIRSGIVSRQTFVNEGGRRHVLNG